MRSDHTAADFAQSQSPQVLATVLEADNDIARDKSMRVLTRVTFCFAWLFGLEPFLTGYADDAARSRGDRSH
jgi:hypothetical protein